MEEEINNKVYFENEINRILNKEIPYILEQLKPFLNTKVLNVTGQLTKKIKDSIKLNDNIKAVPLKDGNVSIHWNFITCEYNYLKYKLSLCFSGGDIDKDMNERRNNHNYKNTYYCVYVEKSVYLSKLLKDSFYLTELEEFKPYSVINADEELKQIVKVKALKDELRIEENKINYCLRGVV